MRGTGTGGTGGASHALSRSKLKCLEALPQCISYYEVSSSAPPPPCYAVLSWLAAEGGKESRAGEGGSQFQWRRERNGGVLGVVLPYFERGAGVR